MTEDLGKLVNLTSLSLKYNYLLTYIPESVSRLQQLSCLSIEGSAIEEVPFGLGRLAKLAKLSFDDCCPLRFPHSLQVSDFDPVPEADCSL